MKLKNGEKTSERDWQRGEEVVLDIYLIFNILFLFFYYFAMSLAELN